ncbi:MAG: hypothetical protein ACW960_11120 [Candidatus Thorarchaeota archaeon]|jgi:DNA-directed RNA polymerase subunit F
MPKEIVSEEEVTLPRVKKLLAQRAKVGELSFQQNPAVADKLMTRLMKNFKMTRAQAVQVVNIAPTTPEEMRTILDARSTDLNDEQIAEIVEIVKKIVS